MDDLTKQVQSLFYNDVHFNAVNARMHTTLKCETADGRSSDQVFKIDTGADGNQSVHCAIPKSELGCIKQNNQQRSYFIRI